MRDIFFNFVNEPTYYVFEWVRGGGLGDVSRLIARAYEKAEHSPWLKVGEKVCIAVRDALADLLRDELMNQGIAHWGGQELDGAAMRLRAGLMSPLLMWTLRQIHFPVVAEALLRDARKWNSSPEFPRTS